MQSIIVSEDFAYDKILLNRDEASKEVLMVLIGNHAENTLHIVLTDEEAHELGSSLIQLIDGDFVTKFTKVVGDLI